ncbi:MAG: DndE family protein [Rhodobacteraceae bacterium]|nr:DndE family protein [Paracoccaceae bacterium]
MSMSFVEVARANFRTDADGDALNDKFMKWLGMNKRYLPARLAISRSLAVPAAPEPLASHLDSGKTIKGDTLFGTGTELSVWLALIVEHLGHSDMDTKNLVALVGAHWKRGLELLDHEWKQSEEEVAKFVKRLVEAAELPTSGGYKRHTGGSTAGATFSAGQINVPIGAIAEDVSSKEKVVWNLNGQGGSPHSAIMGGVGSGKTRTAVAMLCAIREQADVPLLAFDFKGDLGTDAAGGGYHIDEIFGAQTLEPPRTPIPLDVLSLPSRDDIAISEAASRFRDSFAHLKGSQLGARQRTALHDAATRALGTQSPCELHHIRDALIGVYDEQGMKPDGARSTIEEICLYPLFTPDEDPATFFQKSRIIKLPPNVAEDSRTIVVNLVLDALDQHLNSLTDSETDADGVRSLRILCMIDEAHQILGRKLPSLSSLIRMSRSKGGAIMLISQSPDDFSGAEDEFLSEMGLVAAFSTNAPPRNTARILGRGANLGTLRTGECFAKRRGDQSARKIKAW